MASFKYASGSRSTPPTFSRPDPPAIRVKHYSIRTEEAYVKWIRRFIVFRGTRHPQELGRQEVEAFLTHPAVEGKVAATTQNQALNASFFLYRK